MEAQPNLSNRKSKSDRSKNSEVIDLRPRNTFKNFSIKKNALNRDQLSRDTNHDRLPNPLKKQSKKLLSVLDLTLSDLKMEKEKNELSILDIGSERGWFADYARNKNHKAVGLNAHWTHLFTFKQSRLPVNCFWTTEIEKNLGKKPDFVFFNHFFNQNTDPEKKLILLHDWLLPFTHCFFYESKFPLSFKKQNSLIDDRAQKKILESYGFRAGNTIRFFSCFKQAHIFIAYRI